MICKMFRRRSGGRGQTLVEYAIILAAITIVAVLVLVALGHNVKKPYDNAGF